MVVDAEGRAYIGNFGTPEFPTSARMRPTNLVRVDPDGHAMVAAEDMVFPNGMVITHDGRTLLVAESFAWRITAFDLSEDGSLGNRRQW